MSLTQQILIHVPPVLLAALIIGGLSAFSIIGLLFIRQFLPHDHLKIHHEVADPILGIVGTLYAVFLAFIVIAVWQNFDRTNACIQQEANYMADVYRNAEALAPEFQQKLGIQLREYRQAVVQEEWKKMAHGEASPKVEKLMRSIWALYTSYAPRNPTEQAFFETSLQKLNAFREFRRQRLMDSRTGIHAILWLILILGALVTLSLTFLFGAENLILQILMEISLSAIIGLILFTILSMDFPFTGSITISPQPLQQTLLD